MLAHLKIPWATIFKIPLRQYIRVVESGLKPRWCIAEAIFWKFWPWAFFATVTFVCVLAVREWFYMVLKQKNCEKIIMALATNPPPMGKSHEKFPFLGTSPFFSSISSVLSTHKDSFTVQWVEWVALTKSHSNILHTLLCICKREKWDLRSSCFNFFVDFFYLVFILWSYLIRKVVSKYVVCVSKRFAAKAIEGSRLYSTRPPAWLHCGTTSLQNITEQKKAKIHNIWST